LKILLSFLSCSAVKSLFLLLYDVFPCFSFYTSSTSLLFLYQLLPCLSLPRFSSYFSIYLVCLSRYSIKKAFLPHFTFFPQCFHYECDPPAPLRCDNLVVIVFFHDSRFTIHDSRIMVFDVCLFSRITIHEPRITVFMSFFFPCFSFYTSPTLLLFLLLSYLALRSISTPTSLFVLYQLLPCLTLPCLTV